MVRILLLYVLPILLPTAVYLLWVRFARGKAPAPAKGGPWLGLAAAGVGLMLVMLLGLTLRDGAPPDSVYVPPTVRDGRIVPGHMEPRR